MRDHYRDRDHSRSRSRERERERRDNPHRMPPRDSYRNSIKLHVRNLPLTASEDYVQSEFERFGRVEDVKIMRKNANGQPLREFLYGFIQMGSEDEARHALDMINNNPNLGWQVSYSKEKTRGGPGGDYHQRSPERSHRPYDRSHDRQHDRPYDRQHDRQHDRPYDRQHDRPYDRQHDRQYDHYRKDSGDDRYHNRDNRGDRRERSRSPRRQDYDRRRNSQSPEERRYHGNNPPQFQGNALMSLLQNNPNANNPNMANNLMQILQLPPDQLSQLTATMEKSQISSNPILVRELWVGNLPDNLNDKKLKNTVEMFGDIENIENFNKPNGTFAFVKFRKVSQASKAIEGVQNLKLLLDSPNLKVSFSDHQRRRNIVGDNIDYEKDEELVPIIYIGYTSGTMIPPEGAIREVFSAYGDIINVVIKHVPKDNSAKPYALVEMATLDQAKQARSRIFLQDDRGEKRTRLGDRKCELNILIKAKPKDPSNAPQGGMPQGQYRNPMQQQQYSYQQQQQNPPYQPRSQGNYGNTGYNDRQRNYYPGGNTGAGNYQNTMGTQRPYNQGGSQQPPLQNPNQASPPRVHNLLSGTGQNPPPQIPSGMSQGAQSSRYGGSNPMIPTAPNAPQSTFSPNAGQNRQFAGSQGGSQNPSQYPYANPPVQGNPPYNPSGMPYSNPTAANPPANPYGNPPYNPGNLPTGPNYGGNVSTPLSSVEKKGDDSKKNTHMELLDTLQSLFSHTPKSEPSSASKQEEKKKDEAPPIVIDNEDEDANRETIWSGFITKNKQNRVGVDAILIDGDDAILKDYFNLNVGHRTLYEEVIKRQPKTIVLFVPANETQFTLFNDYMKYFKEKQRAGVVTLKKNTLYILPPCEEAFKIHKFKENELLGVFVDLTDLPKETIS